ncbi:MAG: putative pyridoxal-dependent aspartate 1-decarboxylase [Deltaproteobacteria bacterium]|nr:putative pyridoxal-dependent aspartate 1-decarboxylase [Deltaproteobacteria bacterium]MBW2668474.1 putative pyridoxal-dependent aspartate 1-decarboxylase [Deltaproteobacteria bacterium]
MNPKKTPPLKKALVADWPALTRTFIRPENEAARSTLIKYMEQILFGLHDFLKTHVGFTEAVSLKDLADRFTNSLISQNPEKKLADVITDLIEEIAPHAVNVASPYFIGHMTSAIPFFMVHLKTIVAALNQNVVKIETSKVVSVMEKQVLAKIHRLIYRKSDSFYNEHIQSTNTTLGCFTENGTLSNLTALWVARNTRLAPKPGFDGVEKEGLQSAYDAYGIQRCVVLVSKRGHYSLNKSGGLLGIGNRNIVAVDVDEKNRIDLIALEKTIHTLKKSQKKTAVLAVVGIAGTTETGSVDPLLKLGEICEENRIHFHVDAAWGGPTLMSEKYRHLLVGIEGADSVTIDGHKQFYMPMSCGMVYFKDPMIMDSVIYHAHYVNRPTSVDLGIKSPSGSREANSLILDSALKIMGSRGYGLLIDHGIETARKFADEIEKRPDFQLVTPPELNILTYRLCPLDLKNQLVQGDVKTMAQINEKLNTLNRTVQRLQREAGNSFVSRTTLRSANWSEQDIVVLRAVIMNPMTTIEILREILDEQEKIYQL